MGATAERKPVLTATCIDEVVAKLKSIDDALPHDDGVAYFNRLYLSTTTAIRERAERRQFENPAFMEQLDVAFANLYFEAYNADISGEQCPAAWRPLFKHRRRVHTDALQFALAGMNAHIAHDLPVAIVTACQRSDQRPHEGTPLSRDYQRINEILREVELLVKDWFLTGAVARLDALCGKLDDAFAMWSMSAAREISWHNAQVMWGLRHNARLYRDYERLLARSVDLASVGLLV